MTTARASPRRTDSGSSNGSCGSTKAAIALRVGSPPLRTTGSAAAERRHSSPQEIPVRSNTCCSAATSARAARARSARLAPRGAFGHTLPDMSEVGGAGKDNEVVGSVDLTAVTKRFGTVTAVDAIDLHVYPGEFLSLLGPSGCGKTTTLRMLAGFEDPDEGQIMISGASVRGVPAHRRNVNTVFQNYALFPHMTAAENVAYGLRQKKVDRAEIGRRVGEALEMVKMSRLAARRPREMSGGQQQRIAL